MLLRVLFLLVSTAVAGALAQKADEAQPYGRAAVTVVELGKGGESRLTSASAPGGDRGVAVHLDSNAPCEALVMALTRESGRPAFGWRPAVIAMPEWKEKSVGGTDWPWSASGPACDVYVIFFAPGAPALEGVRKLVAAMQSRDLDARLLNLQINKLRELVGSALARAASEKSRISAANPTEVAGVLRGDEFPWRDFAASVNFSPEQPGVLVFAGPGSK